jgi:sec-independent protein translocase protein TatC
MINRKPKAQTRRTNLPKKPEKAPFIEHLRELRLRLIYVVGTVIIAATAAYFVQEKIVEWLLAPSHNQQFIYTSPLGGIGFLFQVCTYVGITVSIPVAFYQLLLFLAPIMSDTTRRKLVRYAVVSAFLAVIGIVCGYYIGLPAALHYLSDQFLTKQIHALFTIQEYMSFVTIYLLGSALILQVPLLLVIMNHIHRLPPRALFKAERYVIVAAFVISMVMVPTVNVINQLLIAIPIILMYQIGAGLVLLEQRRHKKPEWLHDLVVKDQAVQSERQKRSIHLTPVIKNNSRLLKQGS